MTNSSGVKGKIIELFSPEFLIVLTFIQICFAYVFVISEYVSRYGVMFNYGSLILWFFATFSFLLGCVLCKFLGFNAQPNISIHGFLNEIKNYSSFRLRGFFIALTVSLCVTMLLIRDFYGELPIFLLLEESRNIADIVEDQSSAALGLFGLHRVLTSMLSIVFSFSFMRKYILGINDRIPLIPSIFFISFMGVIGGKREEMVIFLFLLLFLFFIVVFVRNKYMQYLPFTKPISYLFIWRLIVLGGVFFLAIQTVTYLRLEASGEGHETNAEFFRYLSLPLLNLNYIWSEVGFSGVEFELFKPFYLLIPAKWMDARDAVPFVLPEATSPLGFFAISWLYWGGVVGIVFFASSIGFVSRYIFSKIYLSPRYSVLYGFVGWDIIVCHTHNHFLTNVFLPAQAGSIFLIAYLITPRNIAK